MYTLLNLQAGLYNELFLENLLILFSENFMEIKYYISGHAY
jgi:hypothetical protein